MKIIWTRIRFNVFWLWFVSEIWSEHLIPFNYVFRFIASLFQNEHFNGISQCLIESFYFLFQHLIGNYSCKTRMKKDNRILNVIHHSTKWVVRWEIQYFDFFKQVQANKFCKQSTFCWMRKVPTLQCCWLCKIILFKLKKMKCKILHLNISKLIENNPESLQFIQKFIWMYI